MRAKGVVGNDDFALPPCQSDLSAVLGNGDKSTRGVCVECKVNWRHIPVQISFSISGYGKLVEYILVGSLTNKIEISARGGIFEIRSVDLSAVGVHG